MRQYEVTFVVDPLLSGDDVKSTARKYADQLSADGATIVHIDELGLRQLAYPINKRMSGVYYCIEFSAENGNMIDRLELNMRRDETLLRFLTVSLDKFGVKYNQDKREGKIGKRKPAPTTTKRLDEPAAKTEAAEPARPERVERPARREPEPAPAEVAAQ